MILYHGTTMHRAQRICECGFLPRKPSRRVWFAEDRRYALQRARTQARRAHDHPVVLTCDIDLNGLSQRLGPKRIFHRNRVIAINGPVPVTVLRSRPGLELPTTPEQLVQWVNHILRLKPHNGVGRRHTGIDRLSRWVNHRLRSQPGRKVQAKELLEMAQRWLPDFFDGVEIDFERLQTYPKVGEINVRIEASQMMADPREDVSALIDHARSLARRYPDRILAFSLPRIHEAPRGFEPPYAVDDDLFVRLYCALRMAFPRAELVLSTRESQALRDLLAKICITQMSAGSSTAPGGYGQPSSAEQFPVTDHRTVAEVAGWLESEDFCVAWDIGPFSD